MEQMNPAAQTVTDLGVWKAKREVAEKRPAEMAPVRATARPILPGRPEIFAGSERWAVIGAMQKAESRGEIKVIRRNPQWNPGTEQWEAIVRRIKPPLPAWVRPTIWTGVACLALAVVTAVGAWVLAMLGSLSAAWVGMFIVTGLIVLIIRGTAPRRGVRGAVEVDVSVRVR